MHPHYDDVQRLNQFANNIGISSDHSVALAVVERVTQQRIQDCREAAAAAAAAAASTTTPPNNGWDEKELRYLEEDWIANQLQLNYFSLLQRFLQRSDLLWGSDTSSSSSTQSERHRRQQLRKFPRLACTFEPLNEYGTIFREYLAILKRDVPEAYHEVCRRNINAKPRKRKRSERFERLYVLPMCPVCKSSENLMRNPTTHELVCQTDAIVLSDVQDGETHVQSYDERRSMKMVYNTYRRINHANELFSQMQALQGTQIPEGVLDDMRDELRKHRFFVSPETLTIDMLKVWLKNRGHSKYLEHAFKILFLLSGRGNVVFTAEKINTLRSMFNQLQTAYEHCPADITRRCNFPTYLFVFRKCAELCGWDDMMAHFRNLKSDSKIRDHQRIWQWMCEYLNWQVIPTEFE